MYCVGEGGRWDGAGLHGGGGGGGSFRPHHALPRVHHDGGLAGLCRYGDAHCQILQGHVEGVYATYCHKLNK